MFASCMELYSAGNNDIIANIAIGSTSATNSIVSLTVLRTLMLTASEDEQDVAAALRAGARGYILKGSSGHEVVEAVRAIAEGDSYVAPNLAARLLTQRSKRIEAIVDENPHDLTSREGEIFTSNKEIARNFNCTERTIKHHVTNIMQKLDVRNRVQAALKFRPKKLEGPTG
jgi:two-component system nitrate/nitrite response regulator NarL